jgi:hypothetical protein
MNAKRLILIVIIGLLIIGNVFFAMRYLSVAAALSQTQATADKAETNGRVLDFTSMFIDKVLMASGQVDFDTRLSLETAVRNLKDDAVLTQWQKFTASKTEADAQENVKKLLQMLVAKIQK